MCRAGSAGCAPSPSHRMRTHAHTHTHMRINTIIYIIPNGCRCGVRLGARAWMGQPEFNMYISHTSAHYTIIRASPERRKPTIVILCVCIVYTHIHTPQTPHSSLKCCVQLLLRASARDASLRAQGADSAHKPLGEWYYICPHVGVDGVWTVRESSARRLVAMRVFVLAVVRWWWYIYS